MIIRTPVADGVEALLSYEELAFNELLDALLEADRVFVSTFNLDATMLDALRVCPDEANVQLVTNIPNRFERYTKESARGRAQRTIPIYKKLVRRERFECNLRAYFNYSNHSKMILVDTTVGFMGSANFSSGSVWNFEAGIVCRDAAILAQWWDSFVPRLLADSLAYVEGDPGSEVITELTDLSFCVLEPMLRVDSFLDREGLDSVYELSADLPEKVESTTDAIQDLCESWYETISAWLSGQLLDREEFEQLVADYRASFDVREPLRSVCYYEPEERLWDHEAALGAHEDADAAVAAAQASEEASREELIQRAREAATAWKPKAEQLLNTINDLSKRMVAVQKQQDQIDNT